jgi:radical SAM superfamily enzyme YgiQ (UPF0313 family)
MKIGLLVLESALPAPERKSSFFDGFSYTGFRRIIRDTQKKYTTEYCHISNIHKYDFVLLSLISNRDIESLIFNFEKYKPDKKNCKIVVGGAGVSNIRLFSKYIDIACFGRGENQILDILEGKESENVWYKENDPNFEKTYRFRQAQEIVEDEAPTVGCLQKCSFCQYTHIHKPFGYDSKSHYSSAKDKLAPASVEDDWRNLDVKDGRTYTTAWDGFSEETRKLVNKPIKDSEIVEKIENIYKKNIKVNMWIKIYSIVGYPWESLDTVKEDIDASLKLIKSVDHKTPKMKLRLIFMVTPFMAEPLTPMQYQPVNLDVNWRILTTKIYPKGVLYRGTNIDATMVSYITSPLGLLKRMYVNRGFEADLENFKKIIFTKKLKSYKADQAIILLRNSGLVPTHITSKITENEASFFNLRTYININKLAINFDRKLHKISGRYRANLG